MGGWALLGGSTGWMGVVWWQHRVVESSLVAVWVYESSWVAVWVDESSLEAIQGG